MIRMEAIDSYFLDKNSDADLFALGDNSVLIFNKYNTNVQFEDYLAYFVNGGGERKPEYFDVIFQRLNEYLAAITTATTTSVQFPSSCHSQIFIGSNPIDLASAKHRFKEYSKILKSAKDPLIAITT